MTKYSLPKARFFRHGEKAKRLSSVSLICPMPRFPCDWKEETGSPCLHHVAKANQPCPILNTGILKERRNQKMGKVHQDENKISPKILKDGNNPDCIHAWKINSENISTCSKCGKIQQFYRGDLSSQVDFNLMQDKHRNRVVLHSFLHRQRWDI